MVDMELADNTVLEGSNTLISEMAKSLGRIESANITLNVFILVMLIILLMGQVVSVADVISRCRSAKREIQSMEFTKQLNKYNQQAGSSNQTGSKTRDRNVFNMKNSDMLMSAGQDHRPGNMASLNDF